MTFEELIQRLQATIGTIDLCDDDYCADFCEFIDFLLTGVPNDDPALAIPGALEALEDLIQDSIDLATDDDIEEFGYAAQLRRFQCLVASLRAKLNLIPCDCTNGDNGTDISAVVSLDVIADLLCILTEIVIELIALSLKIVALNYLLEPCVNNGTSAAGTAFKLRVFNCLICDFVDELCRLEKMIGDLGCILRPIVLNMVECTPCYVAKSSHREPKAIVQANCTCNNDKSKGCGC